MVVLPTRRPVKKGVREFVAAAKILKTEGSPARFALVGETCPGNPGNVSEAALAALVREGVVECRGWRDDMAAVLRAAVTTDWPGCRHVVADGVTGLLVSVRDAVALAAALRILLADPGRRARMGVAARRRAEEHFSSTRAAERMLSLYDVELASAMRR